MIASEAQAETAPVSAAPAWRTHATALARDPDARRAAACALLASLQLCVWRFPVPGEVRVLGTVWCHPSLLAELTALRLANLAQATFGTLALVAPLAFALLLAWPPWRRYAARAAGIALGSDLLFAAVSPWLPALSGSLVGRTVASAAAGLLGGPLAAALLLMPLAAVLVVLTCGLGRRVAGAARSAAPWVARAGESAESALRGGGRSAAGAWQAAGDALRRRRESRRAWAETLPLHPAEPESTPGGTLVESGRRGDPSSRDEPALPLARLRSFALGYHRGQVSSERSGAARAVWGGVIERWRSWRARLRWPSKSSSARAATTPRGRSSAPSVSSSSAPTPAMRSSASEPTTSSRTS